MRECSMVQRRSDPSLPSRCVIIRKIWSWNSWRTISVFIGWGNVGDDANADADADADSDADADGNEGEEEEDCGGREGGISSVI